MKKTRQLENVSEPDRPTKFKIPEEKLRVTWFRYKTYKENTDPLEFSWKELKYLLPCDFIDHVQSRNITQLLADSRGVATVNDDGVDLYLINDVEPEFWTSFDDQHIYLDNWDFSQSTTVTQDRTSVTVVEQRRFVKGDTAIQALPSEMFPLLIAESKSTCWLNFKGVANQKAEQIASRQYNKMREEEPTVKAPRTWVNYGKPASGTRGRSSSRSLAYHL